MKRLSLAFVLVALVLAVSCTTVESVDNGSAQIQTSTQIIEISKYGNVYLSMPVSSFLESYDIGDIVTVTFDTGRVDAPVVTSYTDVDSGQPLVKVDGDFVEVALSYSDLASSLSLETGMSVSVTLKEKAGYSGEYEVRHLVKKESRREYDSDEAYANFRALSGGGLKENFIYRSANPAGDDGRAIYADYLAEVAGIGTVVNLADSQESLLSTMDSASYYAELYENGDVILLDMGLDYMDDAFATSLATGLRFIIERGRGPVLIHCNEGKDRAGLVSALIEALCGSSLDEIVTDYMQSYYNYYDVPSSGEQHDAIAGIIIDFFTDINGGVWTEDQLDDIARSYLTERAGLEEAEVDSLVTLCTQASSTDGQVSLLQ